MQWGQLLMAVKITECSSDKPKEHPKRELSQFQRQELSSVSTLIREQIGAHDLQSIVSST